MMDAISNAFGIAVDISSIIVVVSFFVFVFYEFYLLVKEKRNGPRQTD